MKIKLKDNIFELLKGEKVFELFQETGKKICIVSDFLKLDREYVEANKELLGETVRRLENAGIKMDYSLTENELRKREMRRKEINKNLKLIRSQINLDEELDKKIFEIKELKIGNKERKFFIENGIETIRDLLELNHYQIYRIFKSSTLNILSKYLDKRGLDFSIVTPFGIIDRDDFIAEEMETSSKEEIVAEEDTSVKEKIEQKTVTIKVNKKWFENFRKVKLFHDYHKHIFILEGYKASGIDLGKWLTKQKSLKRQGKLLDEYINALDSIDIIWEDVRTKEGRELRDYILRKNNIKSYKLVEGEMVTTFNDGTVVSTKDENYQQELIKLDETTDNSIKEEKQPKESESKISALEETIPDQTHLPKGPEAIQMLLDSLKDDNTSKEELDKTEEPVVKNAEYYKRLLEQQKQTRERYAKRKADLAGRIEKLENEINIRRGYSIKYDKLCALIEESIVFGTLLGKEEPADKNDYLKSLRIPEPSEVMTMSNTELENIINMIDTVIDNFQTEIDVRRAAIEKITSENTEGLESMKSELDEMEDRIEYLTSLKENEQFAGGHR